MPAPRTPEIASTRNRVAALSRSRPDTDPDLIAARTALRAAKLARHISEVVDAAPPLTATQLDRLGALLQPAPAGRRSA